MSFTLFFLVAALATNCVASFHVGTAKSSFSSPLSRRNSPTNKFRLLSLRGGANRANPLHTVVVDAVSIVNGFYQSSPFVAAALTCGTKASAADYVAQRRLSKKSNDGLSKIDTARNIAFLLYGAVYQGMAQEFIYNHLYPMWFGTDTSVLVVLKKVLFDLLIQTTLVTLPIAYLTKAAIGRYPAQEGLKRYWEDITTNGILSKYFMLWGPVQCLTFSIVPEHLRVSFIAVVSFFWLIILSTVSARPRKNVVEKSITKPIQQKVKGGALS